LDLQPIRSGRLLAGTRDGSAPNAARCDHGAPVTMDSLTLADAPEPVRDVLETVRIAADADAESLGAYVITMTSAASDVLAVEFLQTIARTEPPQRVVPLFETGSDLERAPSVIRDLFAMPWYRSRIKGRQEVMLGYSDSAKDTGRLSAAW